MTEQKISRRRFLGAAGIAIGGTVVACSGLTFLGTRRGEIDLIQTHCEGDFMNDKILIAYASKCGSTGEVAEAISQMWCEQGASVDVKTVDRVADLGDYSAVVVGSAIRYGKWLAESSDFVQKHRDALAKLPVAIFSVHMNNCDDSEESRQAREAYTAPVHEMLAPKAEVFFSGVLDAKKLNLVEKLMLKAMKAETGDFRNWEAIRDWCAATYPVLTV